MIVAKYSGVRTRKKMRNFSMKMRNSWMRMKNSMKTQKHFLMKKKMRNFSKMKANSKKKNLMKVSFPVLNYLMLP